MPTLCESTRRRVYTKLDIPSWSSPWNREERDGLHEGKGSVDTRRAMAQCLVIPTDNTIRADSPVSHLCAHASDSVTESDRANGRFLAPIHTQTKRFVRCIGVLCLRSDGPRFTWFVGAYLPLPVSASLSISMTMMVISWFRFCVCWTVFWLRWH